MSIKNNPSLYNELVELFNEEDPLGLVRMGAPPDEYHSEIETSYKRRVEMKNIGSTRKTLHDVFSRSFGAGCAGTPDVYSRLAERLFATLRREGLV
jgi:hypothetical protein